MGEDSLFSGLGEFLKSPGGQSLLAGAFGALSGRGTRAQAIGQGGLAGLLAYGRATDNQADMARQKMQDEWVKTQRDWMTQDRARADADRGMRESFMNDALAPKPMLQPSAAPDQSNDYTNPDFLFQAGKSATAPIPGMGSVPMGLRQINAADAVRNRFSVDEAAQLASLTKPRGPNLQTFKPGEIVRNMDTGEIEFQAPEKSTPTELTRLVQERDALPPSHPMRAAYDQAIRKHSTHAPGSNVSINMGQKGLDNEFKLRGEFKSEPVYKAHQEMQAAYGQIKRSIAQASPAGDLAAATKIMKLLDPGSVVRESELGMAMQASGLMDRLTNYASMVATGQKLTPTQRKDFQSLADSLYSESVAQFNAKRTEYERLGGEYGLDAGRALGPTATPPGSAPQGNDLAAAARAELERRKNGGR